MPVTTLSAGNLTLVAIVGVVALVALFMAYVFRREVLLAGDGTPAMQDIARAVQEGASAFLSRQFRTLGVFAVVAFLLLHVVFRSIVIATFSILMNLVTVGAAFEFATLVFQHGYGA